MKEYSLKQENFYKLQKKLFIFSLISLLWPIILYIILRISLNDFIISRTFTLVFLLAFALNLFIEAIKLNKARKDWISFKVIISDVSITKMQFKTPRIEVYFKEITRIMQETGGASIQTVDPKKFIYIPSGIEKYEELINTLNAIKPIEVSPIISLKTIKKIFIALGVGFGIFLLINIVIVVLIYFMKFKVIS